MAWTTKTRQPHQQRGGTLRINRKKNKKGETPSNSRGSRIRRADDAEDDGFYSPPDKDTLKMASPRGRHDPGYDFVPELNTFVDEDEW